MTMMKRSSIIIILVGVMTGFYVLCCDPLNSADSGNGVEQRPPVISIFFANLKLRECYCPAGSDRGRESCQCRRILCPLVCESSEDPPMCSPTESPCAREERDEHGDLYRDTHTDKENIDNIRRD